jgi:hypothetical protein
MLELLGVCCPQMEAVTSGAAGCGVAVVRSYPVLEYGQSESSDACAGYYDVETELHITAPVEQA